MPAIKHAYLRYRIIDRCIRDSRVQFPSIEKMRLLCEEQLYGHTNASDLSASTIEKDLRSMRDEFDAPIKFNRLKGGYYYEDPNYSLDKIPLSAEESVGLKFALLTLGQYKEIEVFSQFKHAIEKIMDRVYLSDTIEDDEINKYVQFESVPQVSGSKWLNSFFLAIKNRRELHLSYFSLKSNQTKSYIFQPYLIKEYRQLWYAIGFDDTNKRIATFELSRVNALKETGLKFKVQPNFNADDFFKYAFGITVLHGVPEQIELRFNKSELPFLKAQPLHHTQQIELAVVDYFTLKLQVYITNELIMALLGFGEKVKVIQPNSLANTLKETHRKSAL